MGLAFTWKEPLPGGWRRPRAMTEHATTVQVRWGDVDPAECYDLACEAFFAVAKRLRGA